LANINIIEKEKLVQNAARMGAYIRHKLEQMQKYPIVGQTSGIGLLLAVKLVADRVKKTPLNPKLGVGSWIREFCYQHGMILRNNGDILVVAPSLIINKQEADFMLGLIEAAIKAAIKKFKLNK